MSAIYDQTDDYLLDMGHTVTAVETVEEVGDAISNDVPSSLLTADSWL